MEAVLAYITTKDKAEALALGQKLVENRLAACVNILPVMESLYWWEGKIENSHEAVLLAKTSQEKFETLVEVVKKHHSYSTPCVLALPILGGNPDYLKWLAESVGAPLK